MKLDKEKLLLVMANACLTVGELSKQSGVSRPALTGYKNGKKNPKPATIGKLAKALKVNVTEIITNEGAATPKEKLQDSESSLSLEGGKDESNKGM